MTAEAATVVETHVSWVVLIGGRAYKLKKPVCTGFLDFSTVEARRRACEEEVRLNRRLAPDVYLGVDTVRDADGREIDSVVVMKRMPSDRRLTTLVSSGADVNAAVRGVAHQVATLHLASVPSPSAGQAASLAATLARWEANHADLVANAHLLADPDAPVRVFELAQLYIRGRERLFAERVRAGRAVDGHGDLQSDDIFVLDDGPRILDALEFDESLRLGDGLADIAFLAMDLERLGAPELAGRLLGWYQEFTADRAPASLVHHYIAYRAQVRAKVACLRAVQKGVARAPDADALLALAERHLQAGRVRLVLIGGAPGTGKSTLARQLADPTNWVVLRSDEIRKELAGLAAVTAGPLLLDTGIHDATLTALTYGELLHRAEQLLQRGETVVVDATWADSTWRHEASGVAHRVSAELVNICCVAPGSIAEERVAARLAAGGDASDATPEVARFIAERFAPWPEAAKVDTSQPLELTAGAVRQLAMVG